MRDEPNFWGSRNAALAAIGLNVLVDGVLTIAVAVIDFVPAEVADFLVDFTGTLAIVSSVGIWIGALGFLPWLKGSYARARAVTESPALETHWQRGTIVGFFIPFLNLVRPYQVVKTLDDALDPDLVPELPPQRVERAGLYRDAAAAFETRATRTVKRAPVVLWWSLWIGRMVAPMLVRVSGLAENNSAIALQNGTVFAAALAAFVVIWRISERLREVERRRDALTRATVE